MSDRTEVAGVDCAVKRNVTGERGVQPGSITFNASTNIPDVIQVANINATNVMMGVGIFKTNVTDVSNMAAFGMWLGVSIERVRFMLKAGTNITSIIKAANCNVTHVAARFGAVRSNVTEVNNMGGFVIGLSIIVILSIRKPHVTGARSTQLMGITLNFIQLTLIVLETGIMLDMSTKPDKGAEINHGEDCVLVSVQVVRIHSTTERANFNMASNVAKPNCMLKVRGNQTSSTEVAGVDRSVKANVTDESGVLSASITFNTSTNIAGVIQAASDNAISVTEGVGIFKTNVTDVSNIAAFGIGLGVSVERASFMLKAGVNIARELHAECRRQHSFN